MDVEARLLGGAGEGAIYAIEGIKPEIVVARPLPVGFGGWQPELRALPIEHHVYTPRRAVVYYEVARVEQR